MTTIKCYFADTDTVEDVDTSRVHPNLGRTATYSVEALVTFQELYPTYVFGAERHPELKKYAPTLHEDCVIVCSWTYSF